VVDASANTSKMNAKGENSFVFAILGTALYFWDLLNSFGWIADDKQAVAAC
jgi:hypothetical protein